MVEVAARVVVVVALEQEREREQELEREQEREQEQEQVDLVRKHFPKSKSFLTICSVWRRIGHDLSVRRSCWSADGRR